MDYARGLRMLIAGTAFAASVAMAGLPIPGADRLGWSGTAAAQAIDIDYFYDQLGAYGEWVWHPRFGYVWLPDTVSESWRPYTVGHWIYTDEYGWYWDSYEPFAWAVYHYGRWGYDLDYGWFWVPGDTWAPAWVQWRYGESYVGWAPIGPRRGGYAYGLPLSYEPSVAEAWVFVAPRYLTSRSIYRYALPPSDFRAAFYGAPNVYRPEFRGGVVFNFGMPRDRVVKIIKRPIIVQKVYRVDRKGGRYGKFEGGEHGIRVFAPGFDKGAKPNHKPKKFSDSPFEFKPKTKLKHTFEGKAPKDWGPSATEVEPVAKEIGPHGFGPKHGNPDQDGDQDKGKEWKGKDNVTGGQDKPADDASDADQGDKDKDKGHFVPGSKGFQKDQGGSNGAQGDGSQGGSEGGGKPDEADGEGKDKFKHKGFGTGDQGKPAGDASDADQGDKDKDTDQDKGRFVPGGKAFQKDQGGPNGTQGAGSQGGSEGGGKPDEDDGKANKKWKHKGLEPGEQDKPAGGNDDNGDNGDNGDDGKHKGFGPGGQGAPGFQRGQDGQNDQGNQGGDQDDKGKGKGQDKDKKNKDDKCQKHPEEPECQNPN